MLQIFGIGIYKRGLNKYMLGHGLITTIVPFILITVLEYPLVNALWFSLLTLFSHITIDISRQEIHSKYKIGPNDSIFWKLLGVDQILHIYFIFLGIQWFLS